MIVMLPADANQQLAELARAELRRHPPRTPERAAAAQLHTALVTTKTIDAARRAIRGFDDQASQDAALGLLARLAATFTSQATTTTT